MATVIFKPTENCNARCIYCDGVRKNHGAPLRMSLELLELFFSRINEFLVERPQERLEVIWHGGEPLMLGPDYFAKAAAFQQKHCSATSDRITHSIQSNLTLLSRDFIPVLKQLGINGFGTSYDPIGNVRGLGKARDSRSYSRLFLDAISLLEEEGFGWGIIYVVTKLSLAKPLEIFHFLSNLSKKGSFSFNAVLLYGSDLEHLRISPEEFADFLGAIFPTWWRNREEFPQVPVCIIYPQSGREKQTVVVLRLRRVRLQPPQPAAGWKHLPVWPVVRLGLAELRLYSREIFLTGHG